jgi:hypothetical protein
VGAPTYVSAYAYQSKIPKMRDEDFGSVMVHDGAKSTSAASVSFVVIHWLGRCFSTHEQRLLVSDAMADVADVKELVAPRTSEGGRAWFRKAKATAPPPNNVSFFMGEDVMFDVRGSTVFGKIKGFRKDGAYACTGMHLHL